MSKKDKYIPLVIVVLAALIMATAGRFIAMNNAVDLGTANLIFVIILIGVVLVYFLLLELLIPLFRMLAKRIKVPQYRSSLPAEEVEDKPITESEDWREQHNKQTTTKIGLFLEYTHLALGAYVTEAELARLDDYIERYAKEIELPKDIVPIKPERLKNPDLFHFGWNMAHYFGQQKQEVVPWLQSVFTELRELEYSYIKGKLHDHQTKRYIIPNVDDIPKYLAGKKL